MKDIVKLGTLGDIFIGLTYRPEDVANEGTIVLRSSNIQNGKLDFADIVRVKCKVRENLIVKPNDILMCSRNGSAKLVGKCTLLPKMDPFGHRPFDTVNDQGFIALGFQHTDNLIFILQQHLQQSPNL